jgi:DNA-directed RNA polymerase subunit RPC12/RpoP
MLKGTSKYINCSQCGARILAKRINKHKAKCLPKAKSSKKQNKNSNTKKIITSTLDTAHDPIKERRAERQLDGSRDYAQIRDQGKFGSHSTYDDMGDEASA